MGADAVYLFSAPGVDDLLARKGYAGAGRLCHPGAVGACDSGGWAGYVRWELRGVPDRDGPV